MRVIFEVVAVLLLFRATAFSADLVGQKTIVTYTVSLDSIFPSTLLQGGQGTATISFTIKPSNRAKYTPKSATLFVDNVPIDITAAVLAGKTTYTLKEGQDLTTSDQPHGGHQYSIYIDVDQAQSLAKSLTVWNVYSQTSINPSGLDSGRTNLGIGEVATVAIFPSGAIPDADVDWAYGGGSLSPTIGNTVTFTASKTAGTANGAPAPVTATINGVSKAVSFTIFSPTNLLWQWTRDGSLGAVATSSTNAISIGAESFFNFQITPTNVSFANVFFAESIPAQSWTWPDGTTGTRPADQIGSRREGVGIKQRI